MSMEKRKYGIIARRRVLSLATTATRFHQCLSNCSTDIGRNDSNLLDLIHLSIAI